MTTEVRGATPRDYSYIREVLNDASGNTDDELGIWDTLVTNDPSFTPECARIVVVDERLSQLRSSCPALSACGKDGSTEQRLPW